MRKGAHFPTQSSERMDKKLKLYTVLAGTFLTALILAEITGGKLIQLRISETMAFTMTMGVIPFPITFLITDLLNEYYGRRGIRFVTLLGMGCVLFALVILQVDMVIPAAPISPVKDDAFNAVFGVSTRIIVGSLMAYLVGQLVDIAVFHAIRMKTGGKYLWLRATGSTIVSQLIDSFVVLFIAFGGTLAVGEIVNIATTNYVYKFLIALAITPLLYVGHAIVDRYLGKDVAEEMMRNAHPTVVEPRTPEP
jgi:uncharacterized integral membrane protein (TIGR00697 family)